MIGKSCSPNICLTFVNTLTHSAQFYHMLPFFFSLASWRRFYIYRLARTIWLCETLSRISPRAYTLNSTWRAPLKPFGFVFKEVIVTPRALSGVYHMLPSLDVVAISQAPGPVLNLSNHLYVNHLHTANKSCSPKTYL